MPDRMVREGWKTSHRISQITEGAETLLLRLILSACNHSRYFADPSLIKATVYPNRPRIRTSDIASRLEELEKAGLIVRYSAHGGQPLLYIPRFGQHLKYQTRSPYPAPPCGPQDAPGQGMLEIAVEEPPARPPPDPDIPRARAEKRSEVKSPHSPPTTGGDGQIFSDPEARKPRRFRTQERRAARISEARREIEVIRTAMLDIYHPGGCAQRVTPRPDRAAQADKLRARWDALEAEIEQLEQSEISTTT